MMESIYIALIRSASDCGCVVYGSASKTPLSVPALQVLAGEMPLEMRRRQLMIGKAAPNRNTGNSQRGWVEGLGG